MTKKTNKITKKNKKKKESCIDLRPFTNRLRKLGYEVSFEENHSYCDYYTPHIFSEEYHKTSEKCLCVYRKEIDTKTKEKCYYYAAVFYLESKQLWISDKYNRIPKLFTIRDGERIKRDKLKLTPEFYILIGKIASKIWKEYRKYDK